MAKMTAAAVLAGLVAWHDAGQGDSALTALVDQARALIGPKPRSDGAGESFYHAFIAAKRAALAELGPHWYLVPGAATWANVPGRLRAFKTERGTTVKMLADQRIPAARFWPGGAIPVGVVLATETPRFVGEWPSDSPNHPDFRTGRRSWSGFVVARDQRLQGERRAQMEAA